MDSLDSVWREDAIRELLEERGPGSLFVAGCKSNQVPSIRCSTRSSCSVPQPRCCSSGSPLAATTPYGRSPEERSLILRHVAEVEPCCAQQQRRRSTPRSPSSPWSSNSRRLPQPEVRGEVVFPARSDDARGADVGMAGNRSTATLRGMDSKAARVIVLLLLAAFVGVMSCPSCRASGAARRCVQSRLSRRRKHGSGPAAAGVEAGPAGFRLSPGEVLREAASGGERIEGPHGSPAPRLVARASPLRRLLA